MSITTVSLKLDGGLEKVPVFLSSFFFSPESLQARKRQISNIKKQDLKEGVDSSKLIKKGAPNFLEEARDSNHQTIYCELKQFNNSTSG